jgi:hypothetical protein
LHQAKIELFAMGQLVIRLDESAVNVDGGLSCPNCPPLGKTWQNGAAEWLAERLQTKPTRIRRRFA